MDKLNIFSNEMQESILMMMGENSGSLPGALKEAHGNHLSYWLHTIKRYNYDVERMHESFKSVGELLVQASQFLKDEEAGEDLCQMS